jgi:hypothetical protein
VHGLAAAAAIALIVTIESNAAAQTLTAPNLPARQSAPPAAAQPGPNKHVNSCAQFGPGFVTLPGSDVCVKIGGSVNVQGTSRR